MASARKWIGRRILTGNLGGPIGHKRFRVKGFETNPIGSITRSIPPDLRYPITDRPNSIVSEVSGRYESTASMSIAQQSSNRACETINDLRNPSRADVFIMATV
jgi:hypothetical protein